MATRRTEGKSTRPSTSSAPPSDEVMDVTWDDDTVPRLDLDEAGFERVTQIPELPSEVLAKQMMEHPDHLEDAPPQSGQTIVGSTPSSPPRPPPDSMPQVEETTPVSTAPAPRPRSDTGTSDRPGPESVRPRPGSMRAPPPLRLDLSALSDKPGPASDPGLSEVADRYAMGDYSGALVLAEGILESQPEHPEALRYAKNCREVLTQMYAARLGTLDQAVGVLIPPEQIRWLSLDHRAGFLLSLIDGTSSIEEILDISGMARLDALRILYSLVQERVIKLI